jgi:iron(III) transport system permease protein
MTATTPLEAGTRQERPGTWRTRTALARATWNGRAFAAFCAALTLLLLALLVFPLGSMIAQELDTAAIREVFDDPAFYRASRNTAILVVVPGLFAVAIGSFFAWANERTDAKMGAVSTMLPLAPLVLPQIALSIGWIFLADKNSGVLNVFARSLLGHVGVHLDDGPLDINSWYGMIFLYTIVLVPLVHIMVSAALRNIDPSLEEAARVSGAPVWRTLRTVSLPAIRPAIGASCFLVLLMGVAQFSVPRTIGVSARIDVLSTYLVRMFQSFPPRTGSAVFVGVLVLVVMAAAGLLERRLTRRQNHSTIGGRGQTPSLVRLGPMRWVVRLVMMGYLVVVSLLPLAALLVVALLPYWTSHPDFSAMTLENFRTYFDDDTFRTALTDSALLGAVGATIGVLIAAVLISFSRLRGGRMVRGIDMVARAPGAISHIVLAVAFLIALGGSPFYLANTLRILILVYVVMNLPQAWVAANSAADQVGQPLTEASSISGASSLRTLVRVHLPLMAGGLAAAWAMLFVVIVGDLNASSILASADTPVVGSVILSIFDNGTYSQLAALGSIIAVASGLVVTLVMQLTRRLQAAVGQPRRARRRRNRPQNAQEGR